MHVYRHYTKPNQDPTRRSSSPSKKRNPQPGRIDGLFLDEVEVPLDWSRSDRYPRPKYFRRAGFCPLKACRRTGRPFVSLALRGRHRRTRVSAAVAIRIGTFGHSGLRPSRRRLDYWGWKHHYFDGFDDALAFSTNCASCWRGKSRRRTLPNGSTPASTGPMASTPQQGPLLRRS